MRTIERAAELLEPLDRVVARPADARQPAVERVLAPVSAVAERIAEPRELVAQQEATVLSGEIQADVPKEPTIAGHGALLKVDRVHLRRQGVITPDAQRSANGESFRRIKRQILATAATATAEAWTNLVMVTSALPGEGKTFCAVNLAISMATEMDRTVLLVDADVAKPSVPRTLGVRSGRGLLDVLQDNRVKLADVLCKTDIGKLTFLPAGSPHPHATELLGSDAMRLLLREISHRYRDRIVIFDSPPLLAASEAVTLAHQVGQIILVVEAGKTSEPALKAALDRIEMSNVTGLLLNKGEAIGLRYQYGEYGPVAK